MSNEPTQRREVRFLQVAEHRVAQDVVAGTSLATRRASVLRSRRAEIDEAIRAGDGKLLLHHPIEDRVDRRVGADPEPERQDGHEGDERGAGEGTEGEFEISHASVSWGTSAASRNAILRTKG